MRKWLPVILPVVLACSSGSNVIVGSDAGDDASTADASPESGAGDGASGVDAAEASACACGAGGVCDAFGCPPDYNSSSFPSWCATVEAAAIGHAVTTKTCGSLVLVTYFTGNGCERGYVFDQSSGVAVAAISRCGAPVLTCASLAPSTCVPGCCLDGTCTLGIPALCPAWQPDGSSDAPNDAAE